MKWFGLELKYNDFDVWHKGILTKLSQLTNDMGYVTATNHSHNVLATLADNYRDALALPSTYPRGTSTFFSNNPVNKFNGVIYGTVHTIKGYSNMAVVQYFYPYNVDAPIVYRFGLYNSDTWKEWRMLAITTDIPNKLSQLENDIGAGGGIVITTDPSEPVDPSPGDYWYKEV